MVLMTAHNDFEARRVQLEHCQRSILTQHSDLRALIIDITRFDLLADRHFWDLSTEVRSPYFQTADFTRCENKPIGVKNAHYCVLM